MDAGAYVFDADGGRRIASGDRVVLAAAATGGALSVIVGEIAGPEGPPLHRHDTEDELTMVVSGGPVTVQVGDEVHAVAAGGGYWAPRGTPHTFANLSGNAAQVVSVVAPGGMEDLLDEQGRYLASLGPGAPPDPARIAEIGAAHDAVVLGPPLVARLAAEGGPA